MTHATSFRSNLENCRPTHINLKVTFMQYQCGSKYCPLAIQHYYSVAEFQYHFRFLILCLSESFNILEQVPYALISCLILDSRMNGEGPSSPQSGDSAIASSSLSAGLPTNITPSITLIPIKQVNLFLSFYFLALNLHKRNIQTSFRA